MVKLFLQIFGVCIPTGGNMAYVSVSATTVVRILGLGLCIAAHCWLSVCVTYALLPTILL